MAGERLPGCWSQWILRELTADRMIITMPLVIRSHYSKCTPRASKVHITWEVIGMRSLRLHPDLLSQNLQVWEALIQKNILGVQQLDRTHISSKPWGLGVIPKSASAKASAFLLSLRQHLWPGDVQASWIPGLFFLSSKL